MKLRTKLLVAQLPLVIALASAILAGNVVTHALARSSQAILKDNYRSVLAAERMKEAAERIDSGVAFAVIGRTARGLAQIDANAVTLDAELRVQQGNITEVGERDATGRLATAWTAYRGALDELRKAPEASDLDVHIVSVGGDEERP